MQNGLLFGCQINIFNGILFGPVKFENLVNSMAISDTDKFSDI